MCVITVVSQASLGCKWWRRERAQPRRWQLDAAYFHLSQHSGPVGNSTEHHSLDMEGSGSMGTKGRTIQTMRNKKNKKLTISQRHGTRHYVAGRILFSSTHKKQHNQQCQLREPHKRWLEYVSTLIMWRFWQPPNEHHSAEKSSLRFMDLGVTS